MGQDWRARVITELIDVNKRSDTLVFQLHICFALPSLFVCMYAYISIIISLVQDFFLEP